MGIGYNHASRLIDMLEERGIIGPARSIEPRRVINWDKFGENQDVAE
jgi:DNA segregation ATPase FtsK/SpoIIIE-like protein